MDFNKLWEFFPNNLNLLNQVEQSNINKVNNSKFTWGKFNKFVDSFLQLFTDDYKNTIFPYDINVNIDDNGIILLYSEIVKRVKASINLANTGYLFEGVSILRSVYELNIGINAIHNNVIKFYQYLGEKRGKDFEDLSEDDRYKKIQSDTDKKDKKINSFNDKNIPNDVKKSLKIFKKNMHLSVHKSFSNLIVIWHKLFSQKKEHPLFLPVFDDIYYGMFLNHCSLLILMTLKNFKKEIFFNKINKEKVDFLIALVEFIYENSSDNFHKDMIKYIRIKF